LKYSIYISDTAKKTVIQLPVIPAEMPSFSKASKNEEFETFANGIYNIIGDVGLTEFTLESFFPAINKSYSFQNVKNVNPYTYIDFINLSMISKTPIRVVIVRSDGTYVVNNTFSIESFEYHEDKKGDFPYTISLKQWRDYGNV
jgi:hypothetical protein